MSRALVIFSGGQDSTTCLGWALKSFDEVEAITFGYGQKHSVEQECAATICQQMGVKQAQVDMGFLPELVESALTSGGDVTEKHRDRPELPASFVPNRNALFLTLAHAYAQKIGAEVIVTGVCETDYSGYPDCRQDFIDQIQKTLNMGSDSAIVIETPLMYKNKAQVWALAEEVGVYKQVLDDSHTCYNGSRETNPWGAGCGECPACKLRAKGWRDYMGEIL